MSLIRTRTTRGTALQGAALVLLLASLLAVAPTVVAGAVDAGVSDRGVVPDLYDTGTGGNVTCAEVDELDGTVTDLASSDRRNWTGGGFDGADWPDGVSVTVTDGTAVAWTSTAFPLAAVIAKGGSAANVYVYAGLGEDVFADGGLVAPVNASGSPAGLSNLTLCWDAAWTPPEEPDLEQRCLQAAAAAMIDDITWVTGRVLIRDGIVDPATVPDGFMITFDLADGGTVGFVAPDPVAVVVTAASAAVTHLISPPATTGSVPLSSNPGDGDVVLCGVVGPDEPEDAEELSCEGVPEVTELGPVPIVDGSVDAALVPDAITALVPNSVGIDFVAEAPVVAVVVAASEPLVVPFEPAVLKGVIPVLVDDGPVEILFCITSVSEDPDGSDDPEGSSDPGDQDAATFGTLDDPTTIPTGGGPSGRTTLALVAFVLLALGGSTSLLVWLRGG